MTVMTRRLTQVLPTAPTGWAYKIYGIIPAKIYGIAKASIVKVFNV